MNPLHLILLFYYYPSITYPPTVPIHQSIHLYIYLFIYYTQIQWWLHNWILYLVNSERSQNVLSCLLLAGCYAVRCSPSFQKWHRSDSTLCCIPSARHFVRNISIPFQPGTKWYLTQLDFGPFQSLLCFRPIFKNEWTGGLRREWRIFLQSRGTMEDFQRGYHSPFAATPHTFYYRGGKIYVPGLVPGHISGHRL